MALLPVASTAVQSTVVRPTGKLEPDGGTQVTTGAGSQSSVAVTVKLTPAAHWPANAITIGLVGPVRTGGAVSGLRTITRKAAGLVTPKASTATQVTVLVLSGKVLPEGGRQVTGTFGWQVLVAVTLNAATAPDGPVASTTRLVAPRNVGGLVRGSGKPTEV